MGKYFSTGEELQLPLIGSVTAGLPILAEENIERDIKIPPIFSAY